MNVRSSPLPMDSLSGQHLVGRRLRKLFPGYGVFEGSITSFNPTKAFYKVEYEDGDREDMELHQVQQFLLQETPFRSASPLASDDDDDGDPNAGRSPSSSPTHKHGSAASSPSSDVFHQTPMSNFFSFPSLEISNMPLSQDLYTQSNCSSKRKLDDVCNAVETSFICTKVKKARRKVKEINDNVPSYVAVTWINQCVKDLEEDEVSISEHVESHAHDVNEKTECLENVMMYANSHMKNSQNLSHGYEDAESFIASYEESIGTDIPSSYSSVSVEYAIQDSNHDATTLPFLEPSPPSSNDFLVPQDLVLDFLETYSFLRSFSQALFLSPFTLESFQQCLCSHTPTGLMDSVHLCLLQALRRNLERLAKAGLAIARGCLSIKSCTGSKLNYYNFKDLPIVVYWLEKMSPFCDPVKSKILHHWCLVQRTFPESCVLGISPQEIILKSTQTCEHSHPRGETVEGFAGVVAKESTVTERCVLALPVPNLESMPGANKFDLKTEGLTSRRGFTENTRIETISLHHPVRDYVGCHNLTEIRADSYSLDNSIGSDGGNQCFLYTNYYSQGDAAATAAASLATRNAKRKLSQYKEGLHFESSGWNSCGRGWSCVWWYLPHQLWVGTSSCGGWLPPPY